MKAPVSLTSFRPQKSLAIAIGVLAVVVLPFLSYYTVNEGERGILRGWVLRSLLWKA